MKITISGKNIDVTDGLRTAVQDKIGKLERYFMPETEGYTQRGKGQAED